MRRLGLLTVPVVLLVLAGCGAEEGTDTTDPAGPPGAVDLLSGTAVGGEPADGLTRVDEYAAAFLQQFRRPDFVEEVRASIEDAVGAAGGGEVWAGVVALGCDVPTDVTVSAEGDGYLAEARPVAKPLPECLAPVTTVAVVVVG